MGNSAAPTPDFSKAIPITGNGATPDFGNAIPVSGLPPADNAPPKSSILDLITPAGTPQAPAGHSLDVVKGISQGAVSGMQDTLSGLSKVPGASALALPVGLFRSTVSPEDLAKERAVFAPKGNKAQEGGQLLGGILEFIMEGDLGDFALKGVNFAQRLGLASKLSKFAEENPYLGKLIDHAFTAGRQGLVTGTEETTKTGDIAKGAAVGAGTALGSAALGAAGETMGKARSLVSEASGAPGAVREAVGGATAKAGVEAVPSVSLRQTAANAADAIEAKGSSLYKKLDDAVGGQNFQRFLVQEKAATIKLRNASSPEEYDKIADQIDTARSNHLLQIQQLEKEGKVDPGTYDQAKSLWAQKSKMEELNSIINRKSNIKGETGTTSKAEKVTSSNLQEDLIAMKNKNATNGKGGNLSVALGGDEEAAQLIHDVSKSADAQTVLKIIKYALVSSGILTGLGLEAAHRMSSKPTE